MAADILNNCMFNPTLGGTTDWTVSTAVTGYMTPTAAGAVNGATYKYRAESSDLSQWEYGEGTWNSGTGVLSRTTVIQNSSGTTSKINFTTAPFVGIVHGREDTLFNPSPALTGTPTAPTAAAGTNTTQIATTAFVTGAIRERLTADRIYVVAKTGSDSNTGQATTSGTVTFTNGSANIGWTAHGRSVGDVFSLTTTGTLPTNFAIPTTTANGLLYVKTVVDANTITVAATSGGSAITAGSAGSGTHTAHLYSPFLTIQKAIDVAASIDGCTYAINIHPAGGSYVGGLATGGCSLKAILTSGDVSLIGAGKTLTSIDATSSDPAIWAANCGTWAINGVKLTNTGYWNIFIIGGGTSLSMNDVDFSTSTTGHISMTLQAKLRLYNCTISDGASYCASLTSGASLTCVSVTVTLTGTPAWGVAFLNLVGISYATFEAVTFSGAATGPRYTVTQNSVCYVAGAGTSFLPGNAAHGTPTGSGGQYI